MTSRKAENSTASEELSAEVPLQVTVPPRIKQLIDLLAVNSGKTKRALVLEGLRTMGLAITDEEVAGRRGTKR